MQHGQILKSISDLSEKFDKRTDGIEKKTDGILGLVGEVLEAVGHFSDKTEQRLVALEGDMSGLKGDVAGIRSDMVTRDYLDEKLWDLKGDLTVLIRKEDHKLAQLVNILETRKVISAADVATVFAMEPFPHTR